MHPQTDVLSLDLQPTDRRKLLPMVVKIFTWLFMICGAVFPPYFLFCTTDLAITSGALETELPDEYNTIFRVAALVYLLKGITAYALWTGKKWAINLAMFDACVGFAICLYSLLVVPQYGQALFHLMVLIPWFKKLLQLRQPWSQDAILIERFDNRSV